MFVVQLDGQADFLFARRDVGRKAAGGQCRQGGAQIVNGQLFTVHVEGPHLLAVLFGDLTGQGEGPALQGDGHGDHLVKGEGEQGLIPQITGRAGQQGLVLGLGDLIDDGRVADPGVGREGYFLGVVSGFRVGFLSRFRFRIGCLRLLGVAADRQGIAAVFFRPVLILGLDDIVHLGVKSGSSRP